MEVWFLIIAALAVIVSPFVSYIINKKQIYSQYLISERQEWLKSVRDLTAKYLTY